MTSAKTVVSLSAVGALVFIDANYVVAFAQSDILHYAAWFETLVFAMQFVKVGLALGVKELRNGGPAMMVDLFGAELLLMPVFLAAIFVVGVAPIGSLLNQLVRGWMVGVTFAGLPYAAYRIGRTMLRSGPLGSVLPSAIMAAEFGVLLVNATDSAAKAQTGLAGVADFALLGKGVIYSANQSVFGALAVVYLSLLLYAVLGMDTMAKLNRNRALAMGAIATGSTLAWIFAFSPFMLLPVEVLLPPSAAVAGISWWMARGH
jgi:hypothetical protein